MFESSLIALAAKKPRGKAWLSFPLAVALHLVVLVSLGFAQHWNVNQRRAPQTVVLPPYSPPRAALEPGKTLAQVQQKKGPSSGGVVQSRPISKASQGPPVPGVGPTPSADSKPIPGTGDEGPSNSIEDGGCIGDCGRSRTGIQDDEIEVRPPVDDGPILVSGAVTLPVLLSRVEPKYTELARRAHLEGAILVQAIIDEQGRVVDAKILKGLSTARSMGLEPETLDAVSRWRFRPATLHGRPVKVFYSLTVLFKLQ